MRCQLSFFYHGRYSQDLWHLWWLIPHRETDIKRNSHCGKAIHHYNVSYGFPKLSWILRCRAELELKTDQVGFHICIANNSFINLGFELPHCGEDFQHISQEKERLLHTTVLIWCPEYLASFKNISFQLLRASFSELIVFFLKAW